MKIRIFHIIFLITTATLKVSAFAGWIGPPISFAVPLLPDSYNESYTLLTDRNMYAVGEEIRFSALNGSPSAIQDACWSKVIYLHLLKADGSSVTENKYPLSCSGTSGSLYVPDNILTGDYYLCAYTKWMRNFSPSLFSFVPLTIINPFNPELERSRISGQDITPVPQMHKPEILAPGTEQLEILECTPDKNLYHRGEEIHVNVHYPGNYRKNSGRVSVSVAREGLVDTLLHHGIHSIVDASWSKPVPGYLPEIDGLSLSGRIIGGDPPEGIENARVELSIFGDKPRILAYNTNADGSFFYRIDPFAGNREMFIACRPPDDLELEMRIDNDFISPSLSFPPKPFFLDENRKGLARDIMLNMQLSRLFSVQDTIADSGKLPVADEPSIHGLKADKLIIDDYIKLPNLREVFIELLPEVQPDTRRGTTYLSFKGNDLTRLALSRYEPLILVDQIPVYDLDKLLALPPEKFNSIEVFDDLYVIGKTTYGGFINIISKSGDMGGIDLPENSLFFRYQGFADLQDQESITITSNESPGNNDPQSLSRSTDFRNCLYWDPDLSLATNQTRAISFQSIDQPGIYRVVVRGIAEEGIRLYGQCSFRIVSENNGKKVD